MFAEFIRDVRIQRKLLLREFCKIAQLDPRYWSQVELGQALPPVDHDSLVLISVALGINSQSQEFAELRDRAEKAVLMKPTEIEFVRTLPMFCRTIRNDKPTKEEMFTVANLLRFAAS